MFDDLWKTYPRKVSKSESKKVWNRMTPEQQQNAAQALPNHIRYWRVSGTDTQYIPHFSTWLRQERWEDEIEMPAPKMVQAWWTSEDATLAMQSKLGVSSRPGEDWAQLRARIAEKLRAA